MGAEISLSNIVWTNSGWAVKLLGMVKGKTLIQVFRQLSHFKQRSYWGNHLDAMILLR